MKCKRHKWKAKEHFGKIFEKGLGILVDDKLNLSMPWLQKKGNVTQ